MTLLNYSKCECCKSKRNDIGFTLHNVLPANVCKKISEYNVYCNQCCTTRNRELIHVKDFKDKGYTTLQLQFLFFGIYHRRFPLIFNYRTKKAYEKTVDKFFANEDLIKRLGTEIIKPLKAFVKKGRDLFNQIDDHLFSKDKLKKVFDEFEVSKRSVFTYNKKKYRVSILIWFFFWEFIYAMVGEQNIKYIDMDDIDKYCNYLFEDIIPDEEYFNP